MSNTHRLRGLIQAARDAHGWSYGKIAEQTGGRLGRSTVHHIATLQTRTDLLPVEHLKALADGLRVPFSRVRDAALLDAGLRDSTADVVLPETTVLTEVLKDMTPAKRREYMVMALRLAEAYKT